MRPRNSRSVWSAAYSAAFPTLLQARPNIDCFLHHLPPRHARDIIFLMQAARLPRLSFVPLLLLISATACPAQTTNNRAKLPDYETRTQHDPNGIGKFYLGREIAQVMGHQA